MTPLQIGICFLAYTALIFFIAYLTSRKADNKTYFIGNRASPWFVVAYGMIGASLSGVTFMSVPGWVKDSAFSYVMIVLGYIVGYAVITLVLLPLYYKLNLTSIYCYLKQRYGIFSQKSGSLLFIVSRSIGSSLRMFLVINVLYVFVLQQMGVSFGLSALIFISLIFLYTFKGGIKTIVYTDTLQTTFMITAVLLTIYIIASSLNISLGNLVSLVKESDYSNVVVNDWNSPRHWLKQFASGIFITIVMTGLDQDMMQKNLTCKNLRDAQKNMFTFSGILLIVNFIFLFLGASLYIFSDLKEIDINIPSDEVFPMLVFNYFGPVAGIIFVIGLVSAAYSSADGTITSLTTSFLHDIIDIEKKHNNIAKKTNIRYFIHLGFAILLLLLVIYFKQIHDKAVIEKVFTIAGYTYGPLLGLFAFGLFTKFNIKEKFVPFIAIASPIFTYILAKNSENWFNGYIFGFELLIINGLMTFVMLCLVIKKHKRG